MRSIFLLLCAASAVFVLPAERAQANHNYVDLRQATCAYADAAELFHRSLCRCRRSTDYTERLAERLSCAARDLHDAVRFGEDPRRIAVMYDEVFVLHTRLNELVGRRCGQPDRTVQAYFWPLDEAFERLVCAIEGCGPVCPLISNRRVVSRPVLPFPHIILSPSGVGRPNHGPFDQDHFGHDHFQSGPANRFPATHQDPFGRQDLFGGHDLFGRQEVGRQDFDRQRQLQREQQIEDEQRRRSQAERAAISRSGNGRDRFERDRTNEFRRAPSPQDMRSEVVRSILTRILN